MIATSHLQTRRSRELTWRGFLEDTVHGVWTVDDVEGIHHNVTNNGDRRHRASSPHRRTQCNDWSTANNSRRVELSNRPGRPPSVTTNGVQQRTLSFGTAKNIPCPSPTSCATPIPTTTTPAHQNYPTAGFSRCSHIRQSSAGVQPIQGHP